MMTRRQFGFGVAVLPFAEPAYDPRSELVNMWRRRIETRQLDALTDIVKLYECKPGLTPNLLVKALVPNLSRDERGRPTSGNTG